MENTYNDVEKLIAFAEAGEHKPFQFIRTWPEYLLTLRAKRALKRFIKRLQVRATSMIKKYCKDIITEAAQSNTLLAYNSLCRIISFYQEEYQIMVNMVTEYEAYIFAGNLLSVVFGSKRTEEELWDHREPRGQ